MGSDDERAAFLDAGARRPAASASKLRDLGIRPYGVVRIDSAASPADWAKDPDGNTKTIAETFREAGDIAEDFGERLAAEGEICWGGMHSWRRNVELLEMVGPPEDARLPGRHGAHHALHPGLQRARRSPAARGFRLDDSRRARRGVSQNGRARCARGPSTSTSRRTTAR